jgi:predicted RNA-binding Zn ribbon-like protein
VSSQVKVRMTAGVVALCAVVAAVFVVSCERSPERSLEAYCAQMQGARELDQAMATLDADRLTPGVDALRRASRVAPEEIAPQIATVLELTATLQQTMQTARTDKPEALEAALRENDDNLPAVEEAGRAVQDFTSRHCGIDLNTTEVAPER